MRAFGSSFETFGKTFLMLEIEAGCGFGWIEPAVSETIADKYFALLFAFS